MKHFILLPLLFLLTLNSAAFAQKKGQKKEQAKEQPAEALVWYTDMLKAQEKSQAQHKPIFALFTGSDWCVWCKRLQNDVLSKPEFIKWAQKNVILLELDFPRTKALPPEQVQQNNSLQQSFQVMGYPTIWMFTLAKAEGSNNYNISALGSLGYPQGSEQGKEEVKFLEDANRILNNSAKK
ncbi:MAG: thioredoxin family protein [Bacteroidia bacterium]